MAPNFNDQTSQVLVNGFAWLVVIQLVYFAFVRYLLEGFVMPRIFRKAYLDLTVVNQRSFISHVHWLTVKLCLIPAVWPFVNVFFCGRTLKDSIVPNTSVSNADILSVAYFAVVSMFLFEIIYRLKISPVSLIHHTAGCALGAWQVVEQVYLDDPSTESQLRLLILYGVFEVLFETFPHAAVVYYRCQPKTAAGLQRTARVWFVSGCSSLVGTTTELIVMAVFMWRNWHLWEVAMRIVLPILHFAFMAAQVHGARVGFQLFIEFRKRAVAAREKEKDQDDPEERRSASVATTQEDTDEKHGPGVAVRVERETGPEVEAEEAVGVATTDVEQVMREERLPSCCSCRGPTDKLQLPLYPNA